MYFTGSLVDTATYFVRQKFHIFHRKLKCNSDAVCLASFILFHRKLKCNSDVFCQAIISYISRGA